MDVLITGATGMVGKGVLLECLDDSRVAGVTLLSRRSVDLTHPKLREVLHADFSDLVPVADELRGHDAYFHCMGVSSAGMDEAAYTRLTHDVTAELVRVANRGGAFVYVSGQGTDETETSRAMWRRVKGRTENLVLAAGFRDAYAFRPGGILPERGVRSATGWYNAVYALARPFFPLLRRVRSITTTTAIGQAMIEVAMTPTANKRLGGSEINRLAERT